MPSASKACSVQQCRTHGVLQSVPLPALLAVALAPQLMPHDVGLAGCLRSWLNAVHHALPGSMLSLHAI
jgi:hypothetical protein